MASIIVKDDADALKTPIIAPRLFPTTAEPCKLTPSVLKKHLTPSHCKVPESSQPKLTGTSVV